MTLLNSLIAFFFECYADHPDLHSFPTRRSSDLLDELAHLGGGLVRAQHLRHAQPEPLGGPAEVGLEDRKSTRLNSSHANNSYAVFCLKKKKNALMASRSENRSRIPHHAVVDLAE